MATVEHCLFCFEVLSANIDHRKPLNLAQVEASWKVYPKGLEEDAFAATTQREEAAVGTGPVLEPFVPKVVDKPGEPAKPKNPSVDRLSNSTRSSTPASSSSTSSESLDPNTAETTPSSSASTFVPMGMSPIHKKTSQRPMPRTESPLFVTWNTVSRTTGHRSLRGCIGTFESQPLEQGLSDYAIHSSLNDHRFAPIDLEELESQTLEVCVTLLTDYEDCKDPFDWDMGTHGLRAYFQDRRGGRQLQACYLPDVAVEQGWDKEDTLFSLLRKGGYTGKRKDWKNAPNLRLTRFQGVTETVDWVEFKRWRVWVADHWEKENL